MQTRQPDIYAALLVTLVAAFVCLVLRLVARRITRVSLWYDDWFSVAAFISSLLWAGFILAWLNKGLGLHVEDNDLSLEEAYFFGKLFLYFAELAYAFSLAFAKLAILAFYWRMFKTSNIKIPIIILTTASIIWLVLRTFLAIFHCVPVQGFWDSSVDAVCLIDDSKFFFGTVLAHLLLDVAILSLPAMQVQKLQLPQAQKFSIMAMFMFGVFVCIASVVVLVYSMKLDAEDTETPWNLAPIMTWASIEVNLAVVSACLPMLRPIFRSFIPGSSLGSSGAKYATGSHHRHPTTSIRLQPRQRTKSYDESSSTYQLADDEAGASGSVGDFETHAIDGMRGPHTVIESHDDGDLETPPARSNSGLGGILVKNEMRVQYTSRR